MDIAALQSWVGREQTAFDFAAPWALSRLAGLLDHDHLPWRPDELPPLAHWIYFTSAARQSELDPDGHPRRGDFLPPVALPRRMWVGGRVQFLRPIEVGAAMRRRSTIARITAKNGRSGPVIFVTVRHEIYVADTTVLIEEQDIVFRSAAIPGDPEAPPGRRTTQASEATRRFAPDPVQLFRFSALTFNAHRIHYDRDYARQVEGYEGLVVQGPFIATLLMDHFLRCSNDPVVRAFSFRAERPMFDAAPIELCLARRESAVELWAADLTGAVCMSATVECG
jgi:3-methylfumaryl-CoA hydratase